MTEQYEFAWHSGLFLLACLALFLVARLTFKFFNNKLNISAELTDKDNTAFYMPYMAYFIAFVMVIGGVMNSGGTNSFEKELYYTLIYGTVGIVVLNLVAFISGKVMHRQVDAWEEIKEGNIAVGILKGASYLSTGIIISGVMLTEVDKPVEGAVFLVSALLLAVIGFIYYNLITPFNIRNEIYSGNMAVAASTAGAQIAFAILIYAGFQIEHATWVDSLISISIDVLGGFILLPLIRLVVDKVFIPKRRITDELINQDIPNLGLGLFEASAYIGGALLFIWCWNL